MTNQHHQIQRRGLSLSWSLAVLFLLLLGTAYLHLNQGETNFTLAQLWASDETLLAQILALRVNRLMLALVAGGSLALSGYVLQILFNNPLVDPYTTGTASAAAFGANLVLVGWWPVWVPLALMAPLSGIAFSMVSTLLVMGLARRMGNGTPGHLLLAGIALSSLLGAASALLTFLASEENKLKSIIFWAMGGFGGAQPDILAMHTVLLLLTIVGSFLVHKHLNLLAFGMERARQLGLKSSWLFWLVVIVSSVLVGLSVSQAGIIGFVGLMVPHLVRGLWGGSHVAAPALAAIIGGLACALADIVARLLLPPAGLPVGIVTSLAGLPFFLYLLAQRRHRIF